MKRLFILASAAIVALASCARTEVVYNDTPEEIGFKAVTGAVTRAEQTTKLNTDVKLGVLAFLNDGKAEYFGNTPFTANGESKWTGSKYWPLQSNLDFVVYAPYVDGTTYVGNVLTVAADNTGKTTIDAQNDYLYGAKYYDNSDDKGYNKVEVATALKHALAKVTLSFTGSNVTVTSVSLEKPYLKGTFTVDYTDNDNPEVSWSTKTQEANDLGLTAWTSTGLTVSPTAISIMVVPADDSDIIFKYKMGDSDDELTAEIVLNSTWAAGIHYIYNIQVTPQEITFTQPTVADWDDTVEPTVPAVE